MRRCSPSLRHLQRLSYDYHDHRPQPSLPLRSLLSKCTQSTASTSLPSGPTSLPSTSPTSLSPANLPPISSACSTPSPSSKSLLIQNVSKLRAQSTHLLHSTRQYSSKRWVARAQSDRFAKAAKVAGLKSRAAFKLLQINEKYKLFKTGQTIVDLGFAPGSWSQVAYDLIKPDGRVVGVDLLPVQPPRGVSTIQGDFLSSEVQERLREFLRAEGRGRMKTELEIGVHGEGGEDRARGEVEGKGEEKCVDVVLSDMSAPWDLLDGFYKRSVSNPYYRLMNTSGNTFRDHAGSMDLCTAALQFCYPTLKVGGHFVCKFYQGAEDKLLEKKMKAMFHKVSREKPESSRSESKEAYMIGVKRLKDVDRKAIFGDG